MRAIIPAAGLGTRMLPLTRSVPKEMLPAGSKPLIQHVVEEAVSSGLREICIVIREGKEIIRDYFSPKRGQKQTAHRGLAELEELVAACELTFLYQERPRGLGDALLRAKDFVGREQFMMLIPDQLMRARVPAARQLIEHAAATDVAAIWTSLIRLPKTEAPFFAGARGFEFERATDSETLLMGRIQMEEETRAAFGPFDYEIRGFGRTIYPPEIFDYLGDEFTNPQTGEVDLLRTFEKCTERVKHLGVLLEGEACDLGTFEGYYRYLPRFLGEQLER